MGSLTYVPHNDSVNIQQNHKTFFKFSKLKFGRKKQCAQQENTFISDCNFSGKNANIEFLICVDYLNNAILSYYETEVFTYSRSDHRVKNSFPNVLNLLR